MRSTRASAAVERLKSRTGNDRYSMACTPEGFFYLMLSSDTALPEKITGLLALDEFVTEVNKIGPQKPRRVTKFDAAFEKQLVRKETSGKDEAD